MLKVESQYHNPVFRSRHIGQKQTKKLYGRTCTHTVSHFSVFRLWSLSWTLKPSWVPSASLGVLRKPVTSASSSVWGYCDLTWSRAIVWLVMSDRAATCTDSARCFCLVGLRTSFFKIYLLFLFETSEQKTKQKLLSKESVNSSEGNVKLSFEGRLQLIPFKRCRISEPSTGSCAVVTGIDFLVLVFLLLSVSFSAHINIYFYFLK